MCSINIDGIVERMAIKPVLAMIFMKISSSENKEFRGKLLYVVLERYRHTHGVPTRNTRQQSLELT